MDVPAADMGVSAALREPCTVASCKPCPLGWGSPGDGTGDGTGTDDADADADADAREECRALEDRNAALLWECDELRTKAVALELRLLQADARRRDLERELEQAKARARQHQRSAAAYKRNAIRCEQTKETAKEDLECTRQTLADVRERVKELEATLRCCSACSAPLGDADAYVTAVVRPRAARGGAGASTRGGRGGRFDVIPVAPPESVAEAEAALRKRKREEDDGHVEEHCPVCLDEAKTRFHKGNEFLPCGHFMCGDCFTPFVKHGQRSGALNCPVCRRPLVEAEGETDSDG